MSPQLVLKDFNQFIFILNNKILKFLNINTLFLKIIKFSLLTSLTTLQILTKNSSQGHQCVRFAVKYLHNKQNCIVLQRVLISAWSAIKTTTPVSQLLSIQEYKLTKSLKTLDIAKNMKTQNCNFTAVLVVKFCV